jgi:hypothetical protein
MSSIQMPLDPTIALPNRCRCVFFFFLWLTVSSSQNLPAKRPPCAFHDQLEVALDWLPLLACVCLRGPQRRETHVHSGTHTQTHTRTRMIYFCTAVSRTPHFRRLCTASSSRQPGLSVSFFTSFALFTGNPTALKKGDNRHIGSRHTPCFPSSPSCYHHVRLWWWRVGSVELQLCSCSHSC